MTEHVLVVHRWPDGRARYDRWLDHLRIDVSYICTGPAKASVPETAAGTEVVRRTDDLAELVGAAGRLSRRYGAPGRIVALAEGDRQATAELRVLLGCPGEQPSDVERFAERQPAADGDRVRLDGLWDGSRLVVGRLSRAVGGLTRPGTEAVVELQAEVPAAAVDALAARLDRPATVHLELRAVAPGEYAVDALTPWLPDDDLPLAWREVHGLELLAAELAIQLGEPLPALPAGEPGAVAGWLTVRPPVLPCEVELAEYRPAGEPAYAVELPEAGARLTADGAAARLRFRGDSTAAVERAIRQAENDLTLRWAPG